MAPCDIQTLSSIHTSAKLSTHTCSPIHTLLPIFKRQGYLIFTWGFTTTFLPTLALNILSKSTFTLFMGNADLKKTMLIKYQVILPITDAPVLYQLLLNEARLVSFCITAKLMK